MMIIDPPVGPASSESELQAWAKELVLLAKTHGDDESNLESIQLAQTTVRRWLSYRSLLNVAKESL